MKKRGLIICGATLGLLCSKTALKAAAAEATPWQTYLDKAPVQAEQFAADPLGTLVRLFAAEPVQLLRDTMQQYADVLLFLSLAAGLAFLLQDTADRALLELAAAGGCGVLLWQELDKLAAALCTRMTGWKSYLLGFLPVYSGVLAAGGEWNAGAAANGFLLTVLCFIAQAVTLWLQPLLRSYLAISMACGISSRKSLFEGCTLTGRLLRQAIGWAGKAFAALMSIQRVVTVQLDRSASRLGQLLTGSVPIVGQALSNAADAVLAGMQLLKSTLGIAALLSIGAEFAPLYLGLLVHLLFLSCCGWLAGIGGLEYCHKLLQCFAWRQMFCRAVHQIGETVVLHKERIHIRHQQNHTQEAKYGNIDFFLKKYAEHGMPVGISRSRNFLRLQTAVIYRRKQFFLRQTEFI